MATALFTPAIAATPSCFTSSSVAANSENQEYYYSPPAGHHGHHGHHHQYHHPHHHHSHRDGAATAHAPRVASGAGAGAPATMAASPIAMGAGAGAHHSTGALPRPATPPVLSISPPVHRKAVVGSGHRDNLSHLTNGVPVNGVAAPATATAIATVPGQPSLPYIHSTSTVETFRKILSSLRTDDPEEFFAGEENAFLVCDLANVYAKFQLWEEELGGLVEPFFAIKCNPDPLVVKMMIQLGAGFDCASHQEISQVVGAGLSDAKEIEDRIIYANPCKANSFIKFASKSNVRLMTFDNVDELYKVKKYHAHAKMVLRILTDDSGSLCKLGLKFGSPLSEVRKLLTKAKELGIEVVGVSFHVGSGCTNPHLFADAVERAAWAFSVGKELGYDFNLLDIGGGFGGDNFVQIARIVRPVLERLFPRDTSGVRIIAEPGRYFVSEAFEMATNIIARRGKRGDEDVEEEEEDEVEHEISMAHDRIKEDLAAVDSDEIVLGDEEDEGDNRVPASAEGEDAEENVVMCKLRSPRRTESGLSAESLRCADF